MNFKDHSRKRVNRQVSALKRRLEKKERDAAEWQKKVWRMEKERARSATIKTPVAAASVPPIASTPCPVADASSPVSSAKRILRDNGISPRQAPDIAKELTLHRSLMKEIEDMTPRRRSALISGKHLRKAKCARKLSKELHTHRRHSFVRKTEARRSCQYSDNAKHHIATFLCRPNNSDELPGKRDAVKVGKVKRQKHALKDCLHNLHAKYATQFPLKKVSQSTFVKSRPKYCTPVMFANRKVCLCQRHQN